MRNKTIPENFINYIWFEALTTSQKERIIKDYQIKKEAENGTSFNVLADIFFSSYDVVYEVVKGRRYRNEESKIVKEFEQKYFINQESI